MCKYIEPGVIRFRYEVLNSSYNGKWIEYYKNGCISALWYYDNGHRVGIQHGYYESGITKYKVQYYCKRHGPAYYYHENGALKEFGVYVRGEKTGLWR